MTAWAAAARSTREVAVPATTARLATRLRAVAIVASLAFGIGWTLVQGKAFHWDALNYHFYLGYAALHDRFALDFFAAGTPSYINPYAYVPLHLLSQAAVPGVVTAVSLAAVHALILWLSYELALVLAPGSPEGERQAFAWLAPLFAAMNPVLLQGLGTTLVDIPLGALVVAGWIGVAIALHEGRFRWLLFGGVLCGVASALKLSNAFYAVAAMAMIAFLPGPPRRKLLAGVVYAIGCATAFVAVSAPWSWKLWQTFGNPLFPFLNDWFASPDFTSAKLHYERFRPADWQEFLRRPLDMLSPLSRQHTETHAPDLRFAALFLALTVAAPLVMYRRRFRDEPVAVGERPRSSRATSAVALAFVVAWCLWLASSGNGRYFIPMGCVAAALLATILHHAYRRWKRATTLCAAVVVVAQLVQLVVAADLDRDGVGWEGPLLRTESPQRFRDEPHLFLSTSFLSASALLPQWHPASGMMTISGFYALGPDRPGWERAQAMIGKSAQRLRIISQLPPGYDESTGLPGPASDLDVYVRRFGLRTDGSDCDYVKAQGSLHPLSRSDESKRWTVWVTCRLVPDPAAARRYLEEVRPVDVVFDRVESACPNLFHPQRPVTEQMPRWTRLYNMGSEIQLWIDRGRVLYFSPFVGGDPIDIGAMADWLREPQVVDCSRKSAPAFGGLLERPAR